MSNPTTSSITQNSLSGYLPLCASVTMSTFGGLALGGPIGALTGFATSFLDEYLINQQITDKHYLSLSSFWATTTVYPLSKLIQSIIPGPVGSFLSTAGAVLGLALPYFTDDFLDFRKKIEVPIDSFYLINRMFDEKEILSTKEAKKIYSTFFESPSKAFCRIQEDALELYENKFFMSFLKSTSLNILKAGVESFFLYLLATYSSNLFIVNLLTKFPGLRFSELSTLSPYIKEALKILSMLFIKEQVLYAIEQRQNSVGLDQYQIVLEKSTDLLIDNGNGRKILSREEGKELVQNLTPDLVKLMYRGASRLNYILTESSKTLLSLSIISKVACGAIAPYAFLSMLYQKYYQEISSNVQSIFQNYTEGEVHLWDVKFDIANNIDQINLRDGDSFVKHQYTSILSQQNMLSKQMEQSEKSQGYLKKINTLFSQAINVLYYGGLMAQNQISMGKIPLLHSAVDDIYTFLASNLHLEATSKELLLAKKRLSKLFEILDTPSQSKVQRTSNPEGKITIDNYSLFLFGDQILHIDHLEFKPGMRYALTGNSGCGKSSFLIDLKQGVLGALSSTGRISIGSSNQDNPQFMFIDQDLYFPQDSTLFEIVCFPKILKFMSREKQEALKKQVIALFKELKIDIYAEENREEEGLISCLDSQEFKLSGGQRKKIAIIQAILNQPSVLGMDEALTGLDKENSLPLVQKAIQKYLPQTMILSVDHHAHDNNELGFYHSEVHFANGSVQEKAMSSV